MAAQTAVAAQTTVPAQSAPRIAAALAEAAAALPKAGRADEPAVFQPAVTRRPRSAPAPRTSVGSGSRVAAQGADPGAKGGARTRTEKKPKRTTAETVALAARIRADRPGLTEAELATSLGLSASRWRTIRREAAQAGDLGLAA
jgi:hypothetical protein